MPGKKRRLVVILRCPLCGCWLVNTAFRDHQDVQHQGSVHTFSSGQAEGAAILKTTAERLPRRPPVSLTVGFTKPESPAGRHQVDDDEDFLPADVVQLLIDVRNLMRVGLDAGLAWHTVD